MNPSSELRDKLVYLIGLLDELRAARSDSVRSYLADPLARRTCERLVQLILECGGDVCALIAEHAQLEPANSLYECFAKGAEAGALPESLALQLAGWVKLRNRLVHDYDRVDSAALYGSLEAILEQFTSLVKHVEDYVRVHSPD